MAVELTLRPSAVTGLCRPGVSTKTSWASGRLRMPRTRWRVVCGLSETIDTLAPQMALTSDDLPTFGRPTNVTNPDTQRPESASECGVGFHAQHSDAVESLG